MSKESNLVDIFSKPGKRVDINSPKKEIMKYKKDIWSIYDDIKNNVKR
ncbi:hypothetical protein [Mycoplasma sp. 2575]